MAISTETTFPLVASPLPTEWLTDAAAEANLPVAQRLTYMLVLASMGLSLALPIHRIFTDSASTLTNGSRTPNGPVEGDNHFLVLPSDHQQITLSWERYPWIGAGGPDGKPKMNKKQAKDGRQGSPPQTPIPTIRPPSTPDPNANPWETRVAGASDVFNPGGSGVGGAPESSTPSACANPTYKVVGPAITQTGCGDQLGVSTYPTITPAPTWPPENGTGGSGLEAGDPKWFPKCAAGSIIPLLIAAFVTYRQAISSKLSRGLPKRKK